MNPKYSITRINMEKNKISEKELLISLFPDPTSRKFLVELINTLPGIVAILNNDRRLVYANSAMEDMLEEHALAAAFYLRPGEIFQCVNAGKTPDGCGTAEGCEFCGAMQAMERSRSEDKTISSKYRIFSSKNGKSKAFNFRFRSTPIHSGGTSFYLVTLEDLSEQSRKVELERIFFHDLLNSLGALHGAINLIKERDQPDPRYINILEATYNALFDSISEQKQYTQAERGELAVHNEEVHTRDLLIEATLSFAENFPAKSKVVLADEIAEVIFVSDPALLCRVLTNMIKNAVEASEPDQRVTIGADRINTHICFWVHNQGVIPRDIQYQIFERSFSTKGEGRGIGTFSMKLIGETYLGGKVDFSSDPENGTIFRIELPIHP